MAGQSAETSAGVSWRRVVLPGEHGSWSFLAEPLVVGLIVAFSLPGLLLAVAATAAFLSRPPLKWFVGDRSHGRRYPRTAAAEHAFALFATISAAALAASLLLTHGRGLLPLALAVPLAAVSLALDLGRRSREATAEIAAALALAALAPAIALAGGVATPLAFGLWGMVAARAVSTVAYVRSRLRLDRGEPAGVPRTLAVQFLAVAASVALVGMGVAPGVGAAAIGVLGLRAGWGLSPLRPRMSTRRLGATEAVLGGGFALALALGVRLGW